VGTIGAIACWLVWLQPNERSVLSPLAELPKTFDADLLQAQLKTPKALAWAREKLPLSGILKAMQWKEDWNAWGYLYAEQCLKWMLRQDPRNQELILRYCLVMQASGEDACSLIKHYAVSEENSNLLKPVVPIFCAIDHHPADQKAIALSTIENSLPEGWYRQTALLTAYKSFGDNTNYERLSVEQRSDARNLAVGYLIDTITVVVTVLIGLGTTIRFIWLVAKGGINKETISSGLTFKPVYGIFLFTVCCKLTAALLAHRLLRYSLPNLPPISHSMYVMCFGDVVLVVSALLAVNALFLRTGQLGSVKEIFSVRADTNIWRNLTTGFCGFCTACLFTPLITLALSACNIPHETNWRMHLIEGLGVYRNPLTMVFAFVAIALLAPFVEELVFRRLIYVWLRRRSIPLIALPVSGFAFAAIHCDPSYLVQYTVIGIILGIVFEQTGSLWASVTMHALFNGVALLWEFTLT
jgi:membrane protease YdiL (CAAX protease family)